MKKKEQIEKQCWMRLFQHSEKIYWTKVSKDDNWIS